MMDIFVVITMVSSPFVGIGAASTYDFFKNKIADYKAKKNADKVLTSENFWSSFENVKKEIADKQAKAILVRQELINKYYQKTLETILEKYKNAGKGDENINIFFALNDKKIYEYDIKVDELIKDIKTKAMDELALALDINHHRSSYDRENYLDLTIKISEIDGMKSYIDKKGNLLDESYVKYPYR